MPEDHNSQQADHAATLQSVLEIPVGLIAVIVPASIIISFVFDWGYLSTLGISVSEAPITISDHVQSWLVWLPIVATCTIIVLPIEFITRRMERGMTEEEIIASSPNPSRTKRFRDRPSIFIGFLGPGIVILWLLFGEPFRHGLFFGLAISWGVFTIWVFRQTTLRSRYSYVFRLWFYWIPSVLFMVFFIGELSARSEIFSEHNVYKIYRDNAAITDSLEATEIILIRTFDHWFLSRDKSGKLMWIRTDQISHMEVPDDETPFRGLACIFSERFCIP